MKYRILDHVGEAAFEAFGSSERELFENAALALFETMADTKKLAGKKSRTFGLRANSLEGLLHRFLSELIFLKDAKHRLFKSSKVRIQKGRGHYALLAKAQGDEVEEVATNVARTDVKAVTFNRFSLVKKKKGFEATVVLDI